MTIQGSLMTYTFQHYGDEARAFDFLLSFNLSFFVATWPYDHTSFLWSFSDKL